MVDTEKFVSYLGKELKDILSDLVELEEYREERAAELESIIDGFGGRLLDMTWYAPLEVIPNRFIKPFLKDKIVYACFMKLDDNHLSKMIIRLEY